MENYSRFYNELNGQQKLAVDTIDGPLLVLAGPGTGKTQLLSVRAGSILKKRKISPENILILTYTNAAAKAMKERLSKSLGHAGYDLEVCTFHSFANSIIQESEEAANYAGDKIQMDDVERMRAVEYVLDNTRGLEEIRPFRAPYTYLKEILQKISELKKDNIKPADLEKYLRDNKAGGLYLEEKYAKRLAAFSIAYRRYEEIKEPGSGKVFDERGRYDFDDMILFATEALQKEKALREEYRKRYLYVMVDEFQDTNGAQLDLLFTLLGDGSPNLLCVGDDDQSIYRFQGASVGNFKLLSERFPKIKTISLKENYRSSKELIDVSRKIIENIPAAERAGEKSLENTRDYRNKEISFRELTSVEEELVYIVDKVRQLKDLIESDDGLTEEERKHPYNNIAVLVRKRKDILKIADAFLQAGIPYATDGKEDISGEKRVRQLLDALELAHIDPKDADLKDLALYKVLSADYLGLPQAELLRFINFVNHKRSKSASGDLTLLSEFLKCKEPVMRSASGVIGRLISDARTRPVHSLLIDFIKDSGLYRFILKQYSDDRILKIRELRAIGSFVNMVKSSDSANPAIRLDDFMAEMKTRRDHDLSVQGSLVTLAQEGVRVYTAHGSKGLEFHSVIIPFCLHNKNWPAPIIADKIQLPPDLFKTKERIRQREQFKQLALWDEMRLFYVAMTRARSNLVFTASPTEDAVSSQYLRHLDIHGQGQEGAVEEDMIEKSLDATDLEDPFIGTEEVLKDMVSNMTLNPTRINNYITCGRKFLYNDVLKLPGSKKRSLVFGNCVHKALECTYTQYLKKKKFPSFAFFRNAFLKELKFQGADKLIERDCTEKLDTVKEWFERQAKSPVMPISLEKKLMITVGDNIIFTGKYDKVEWDDEKKLLVRIVDYKTGKPDKHLKDIDPASDLASRECDGYLRQLVAYKLLFERDRKESKGRKAGSGELVFIEPVSEDMRRKGYKKGEYATKRVEISESMVGNLEDVIKSVWSDIKELKFGKLQKRDAGICGSCDFEAICWGQT